METVSDTAPATPPAPTASEGLRAPLLGRTAGHWIVLALALSSWAVLATLGVFAEPSAEGVGTHEQFGLPACKTMEWLGVPCPGCGVTTSTTLFAQGRFGESLWNQPFGFLFALLGAVVPLWAFGAAALGRDVWNDLGRLPRKPWAWTLGVAAGIGWIWKLVLVLGG